MLVPFREEYLTIRFGLVWHHYKTSLLLLSCQIMERNALLNEPDIFIGYLYPTTAAGIAYGTTLFLSVACIRTLRKGRQYTKRRRWSLYLYIALGVVMSSISFADDIFIIEGGITIVLSATSLMPVQNYRVSTSAINIAFDYGWALVPFGIWSADCFMVSKDRRQLFVNDTTRWYRPGVV